MLVFQGFYEAVLAKKIDTLPRNSMFAVLVAFLISRKIWVCLKIGYIPNEIAI